MVLIAKKEFKGTKKATWKMRLIKDRAGFTTDIPLTNLSSGVYIDKLTLHWKGEMTAAASVGVASLLDLVNPVEVRLFGSPIVSLRGSDLYALNDLFLGKRPITIVATAATDSHTKIMGLDVPLYQPARGPGELALLVGREAVSGVDTETISIAEIANTEKLEEAWLHYVEMPGVTAGATGYGNIVELPSPGDLLFIIFYSTTIPTTTSETATVQSVKVEIAGVPAVERNWHEMKADVSRGGSTGLFGSPGDTSILDNYGVIDFRKDPIPKGTDVSIDINAGVANEAYRIIPIFGVKE